MTTTMRNSHSAFQRPRLSRGRRTRPEQMEVSPQPKLERRLPPPLTSSTSRLPARPHGLKPLRQAPYRVVRHENPPHRHARSPHMAHWPKHMRMRRSKCGARLMHAQVKCGHHNPQLQLTHAQAIIAVPLITQKNARAGSTHSLFLSPLKS